MKKVLAFGFVIVFASVSVFGQFKFGGSVKTGVQGLMSESGNMFSISNFLAYNHNVAELTAEYAQENFGANLAMGNTDGTFDLNYGYGWVTLKKLVKVSAGKVDDAEWAIALGNKVIRTEGANDVGEGWGSLFQYTPIDDLNFGFGIFDEKGDAAYVSSMSDFDYTFGAAYTVPSVVKFSGSGRFTGGNLKEVYAGASVYKLGNISLHASAISINLDEDVAGWQIGEYAWMKLGDFGLGLKVYEGLNQKIGYETYAEGGFSFSVNPSVSYTINSSVSAAFSINFQKDSDDLGDGSNISFNPYLMILLANGVSICPEYMFSQNIKDNTSSHWACIDIEWSF